MSDRMEPLQHHNCHTGRHSHSLTSARSFSSYAILQNGDLNWIIKDKILAFAGPSYKKTVSPEGYCTLAPADYIPYFQSKNVGLVVRLNKKNYEEQDFIDAGIDHLEHAGGDVFWIEETSWYPWLFALVLSSYPKLRQEGG